MRAIALLLAAMVAIAASPARGVTLLPGDILAVTISRDLIRVDPVTGAAEAIAIGIDLPDSAGGSDVAVDRNGTVYVSGNHGIARVDPSDGSVTPIPLPFSSGNISRIQTTAEGQLIVLNEFGGERFNDRLWRVDPLGGGAQLLLEGNFDECSGPSLPPPFPSLPPCTSLLQNFTINAFTIESSGDIALGIQPYSEFTDTAVGAYRLDVETGAVSVLSLDPAIEQIRSLASGEGDALFLGNVNVPPGPNNCVLNACFQVRSIDGSDGAQTLLAGFGLLESAPIDLAVESDGSVLVLTDAYFSTAEGFVEPRLVRIDPVTGQQQLVSGALGGVAGIAVVPAFVPEPSTALLLGCGLALLRRRRQESARGC